MKFGRCILIAALAASSPVLAQTPVAATTDAGTVSQPMGAMDLAHGFLANLGQYPPGVRYLARTANTSLAVRDRGWMLIERGCSASGTRQSAAIGFEILSPEIEPDVRAEGPLSTSVNFMNGTAESGTLSVLPFESAVLGWAKPHLEFAFRKKNGNFEYDVSLGSARDLRSVRIKVHGVDSMQVADDGSTLCLRTAQGDILQRIPAAWQVGSDGTRSPQVVRFRVIDDSIYGFEADDLALDLPIVVDPVLYSTLLGGGSWDRVQKVAHGATRLTAVGNSAKDFPRPTTPVTQPAFLPTTPGAYQPNNNGSVFQPLTGWNWPLTDDHDIDIFVSQIDIATGNLVYSTFFGGSGNEYAQALHVEPTTGIITFGGHVESDQFNNYPGPFPFPITSNAYQNGYVGGPLVNIVLQTTPTLIQRWLCMNGGFVAQIDPVGTTQLVYSSFYSGSGHDRVSDLFYDGVSRIYLCGRSTSSNLPMAIQQGQTPRPYQMTPANPGPQNGFSNTDGFLTCLVVTPTSTTIDFSTYFGGTDYDDVYKFAYVSPDYVVVGGTSASRNLPTAAALWGTNQSNSTNTNFSAADAFVAAFRPRGQGAFGSYVMTLDFCTYIGGDDGDILEDIAWDPKTNSVVFVGNTWSVTNLSHYPTTNSSLMPNAPSSSRLCRLRSTDPLTQIRFMHGFITRIRIGSVSQSTFPSFVWSTFLGGASNDTLVTFLDLLGNQSLIVGGTTWATNFPIPAWGDDTVLGTNGTGSGVDCTCFGDNAADGFVVRLNADGNAILNGTFFGAQEDDYITHGAGDHKGRVVVGGMTLNSGYVYTRNAQGYATGITPDVNRTFPVTPNAAQAAYSRPQFLVRGHFGDASLTQIPLLTAPKRTNPLGNYLENGVYNAGDGFITRIEMQCRNCARFNENLSVLSCTGEPIVDVNSNPSVNGSNFKFTCVNGPPGGVAGVFGLGPPATAPIPLDNIYILLDPAGTATGLVVSDAVGRAEWPLSLTGAPIGATVAAQFVWFSTAGCPSQPAGPWSSTAGLQVTTF